MKNPDISLDKYALIINHRVFTRPLYVLSVSRSVLPPTSCIAEHIEGRAGAIFKRQDIMPRELIVKCLILANTKQEAHGYIKNVLAPALISDSPLALEFPWYYPDMRFYGVLNGDTELTQQGAGVEIELKFICPDPYMYGDDKTISTEAVTDPSHFEIVNRGSAPCNFVIRGIVKPEINMMTTGATLHLSIIESSKHLFFFSGEALSATLGYREPPPFYIDPYNHVLSIGNLPRDEYIEPRSDRIQLMPGINTLEGFECFRGAQIIYQERWY